MALVASSLIAVVPIAPAIAVHAPSLPDISHIDVALTAGGGLTDIFDQIAQDPSLLTNVATNLYHDFANIPYYLYEAPFSVQGLVPQFLGAGGGYPDTSLSGASISDYPDYFTNATSNGTFATVDGVGPDQGVFYGAINNLAAALNYTQSWWASTPTNIWGWDTGNPWNLTALLSLFTPLNNHIDPATGFVENTLANQTNIWATAELPEDGTGYNNFLFSDMLKEFGGYLRVPMSELTGGYTLPAADPATGAGMNPVGVGADGLGYGGTPYPEIWDGQTVTYDPNAASDDFWQSLLQDPSSNPIMPGPSLTDISTSIENLVRAQFLEFLPINPLDLSNPGENSFLFLGIPELFGIPVIFSGLVWPDFSLDLAHFLDIQKPDWFLNPSVFSNLFDPSSLSDGSGAAGAVDPGDLSDVGSTPAGGAGDLATEIGNLLGL